MTDYEQWKVNFENRVSFINDKKFCFDDRFINKRHLMGIFSHCKEFVKQWLHDPTHKTHEDIVSPKLTKEYITSAIVKYMKLFEPNEHVLEREEFKFREDGYDWYIRKDFIPPHGRRQVIKEDVEYHISASNYKYCSLKSGYKSFFRFIYIDGPGYLNTKSPHYKTIPGTKYRI